MPVRKPLEGELTGRKSTFRTVLNSDIPSDLGTWSGVLPFSIKEVQRAATELCGGD